MSSTSSSIMRIENLLSIAYSIKLLNVLICLIFYSSEISQNFYTNQRYNPCKELEFIVGINITPLLNIGKFHLLM